MSQVFGQVYAPLYDVLYRGKDYDGETKLLCELFQRYAAQSVRSVLDLGCGTGNHALRLASEGYRVVGVDSSAEMLAVAERKARQYQGDIQFHHSDIRNADLRQNFHAAIMMFAVLSYQLEDNDVLDALRTARRHLYSGGLLVFDIWYGPAVLTQSTQERVRTIEQADTAWERSSAGRIDTLRDLCRVEFRLRQKNGDHILDETNEIHTLRYFFPNDIERFLESSRFRLLRLGAFPSFDQEADHTTWNAMVVAIAA
jgi:SAM-dependent methyltransferase